MNEVADRAGKSSAGPLRVLITGGGTGGHVSPALSVVEELRQQVDASSLTLLYIGSEHGIEQKAAVDADIPFMSVRTGKLRRASSVKGLFTKQNFSDLMQVPLGIMHAVALIKGFQPDVVFSTGGYVSVPAVVAAGYLGIPVLAHEQTVQFGLANRITATFATRIALSFEGTEELLSRGNRAKAFVSGNPVRRLVFNGCADAAVARYGFVPEDQSLPTMYVTGGAQGAHVINEAVRGALPALLKICKVIHQCGVQTTGTAQDYDLLTEAVKDLPKDLRQRYAVTPFVGTEIGDVFALADLILARSGAGTVAEVSALGKPAIYVPLVPTGGDEQTKNAARFCEIGAAAMIKQSELAPDTLMAAVRKLADNRELRVAMGKRASELTRPDAASSLTNELLKMAGHPSMLGTLKSSPDTQVSQRTN